MESSDTNKPTTPVPAAGSSGTAVNTSPPKYVPQFSAATEMILKRINSGASASNLASFGVTPAGILPSGYEDMRRSVMMGMKTSMNMEIPTTPVNKGGRRNQDSRASIGSTASASLSKADTPGASTAQKNGTPSSAGKGRKPRAKAGQKRKRAKRETSDEESEEEDSDAMSKLGGDSDSDASGSIQNFPKVTQSGRAIVKPQQFVPEIREASARKRGPSKKSQELALCKRCGRGHSPDNNMIVFCDGCNGGWHQMCHDPPVSNEAVKDEDAPWFCLDCTQKRARKSAPKTPASAVPTPSVANTTETNTSFSANTPFVNAPFVNAPFASNGPYAANITLPANQSFIAEAPLSMPTASPSPRLISWEGRSSEDKRAYFSTLTPYNLISLLMQATALHPDLPIFPSAMIGPKPPPVYISPFSRPPPGPSPITHTQFQDYIPGQPQASHGHPNLFSRAEANPSAPMNFIRKIAPGASSSKNTPKNSPKNSPAPKFPKDFKHASSAPPTLQVQGVVVNGEADSRESTPASPPYPRAGNGLMAKLGPDDQDSEWMVDDGDFEAFSHTLFGVGEQN